MSRVKLLSFDLDDTLWPCEPTIIAAEASFYRFLEKRVPKITQQLSNDQIRLKRLAFLKQHPQYAHDLSVMRLESLKALASEFEEGDASVDETWVDEAFQAYYEARQIVTLFDDVEETMDSLKKNYRLVAISNGNADIAKTGVSHWFEFAVSAADVGYMKPHPAVFQKVLKQSKCNETEILHIGDHQHHDIFGASQLGIRTVWLNRLDQPWEHQECEADFHIKSLTELPKLLAELRA